MPFIPKGIFKLLLGFLNMVTSSLILILFFINILISLKVNLLNFFPFL